ncbi:amino acid adenylation domain-containing protein [Streptomyces sp. DSM 42041]|uniref:Amino acid adenylation domain-containing protein n=1 Tax=Streptomyces hazeniae TaxID=3075538 RepID=A0ABU2NQX7_9ACTN|nr:amino acid adenylation domain-containing protein [Streptomyces sp. DSM 42041]MDT0379379.1 amino acid adenylation domain-containing protein [Streptomyces sp. DSM 42041]
MDATHTAPRVAGRHVDHGPYASVVTLIEDQARRTPERRAVTHLGPVTRSLTYRSFDDLANGLAAELRAAGVRRGDAVPLVLGNSLELPVCMVAVMKLGAAFLLCDPAWPEERLRTIFTALEPRTVLTAGPETCGGRDARPVSVDAIRPTPRRPEVPLPADLPAYGVFTSGSTGTPKCALNVHGGLANRFRFMSAYFSATGEEVVLQNSRHTFDSAIWQLLWPLTTGGRTAIPDQGEFLDLEHIVQAVGSEQVTVTDFVPATLGMLVALLDADPAQLRRVASLRHLVVGGEEIIPHAVHRLRALLPGLEITNGYGPSEASIGMVFHRVTDADGDRIPLGTPIDNCYAAVVDEDLRPVPAGAIGEIVIGGACLGAGYLGDPARTAEAFVHNPLEDMPGPRLYRTGDLGRFTGDGLLRFAGRRDRQAKVAGVRVELGEVETCAEGCPGVIQAKALVLRRDGRTRLAVAVAGEDGTTTDALRAHLVASLPRIHVPHHCLVLQTLPLTDNGKVDLAALRTLVEEKLDDGPGALPSVRDVDLAEGADVPPAERIAHLMGRALDLPGFGVHEDFVARGGDSLAALGVVMRIRELLALQAGVADLYAHRTPQALADALAERARAVAGPGADDHALMERDAVLPPGLADAAARTAAAALTAPASPAGPGTVLVTGACGFVGSRAVHRLLSATDARALAVVRAPDDAAARHRLIRTLRELDLWDEEFAHRLQVRAGDLGEPRFGWRTAEWEAHAAECATVLHVGALVNFLFDYRAHRPANVLGTVEALRFALTGRRKAFHHVSTLGVLDRHAARQGAPLPEDFDPAAALRPAGGYSRSKWVAERLVLAARAAGLPARVYRLGEVMPAADNGAPNAKALTHLLLAAFRRLGLRPGVPMRSDYSPVDEVAATLIAALGEDPGTGPGALHVLRRESLDFAGLPVAEGAPARSVPPGAFLAAVAEAAADDEDEPGSPLPLLHGILTARRHLAGEDTTGSPTDAEAERLLTGLLVDNPALFTSAAADALAARHGLRGDAARNGAGDARGLRAQPQAAAVAAYVRTLTELPSLHS